MSEQVTRRNFLLSDTHVVRCHLPGDSATPPHHSLLLPVQSHNKGSQVRGELYGSRHVVLFFFYLFSLLLFSSLISSTSFSLCFSLAQVLRDASFKPRDKFMKIVDGCDCYCYFVTE